MNKILTLLWIVGMTYGAYILGGTFDFGMLGEIFMGIIGFIVSIVIRFGVLGSGDGIGESVGSFFDGGSSDSGGGCSGGGSCGGGGD